MPFGPGYTGSTDVARGDVDPASPGDEIIVGTGPGFGPPVVSVFSATGAFLRQFTAYDIAFTGGVTVAGAAAGSGSTATEVEVARGVDVADRASHVTRAVRTWTVW